jgi:isocitrate/isopropylmalate dehydrogenase
VINPIACIAAGQMMLDHLGETQAAQMLDQAIADFLGSGTLPGLSVSDIKKVGMSTSKIGDDIAQRVQDM